MRLEFHQLERCGEQLRVRRPERQLRVRRPERQRRLLASLAVAGQQTPIIVVAVAERLDRSLRMAERETALEEGWLLAELERRFGYGLEELARRFDRSLSWVSRRLALVELLPQSVQQQVRSGAITAHVAMKYLVPVARSRPQDCLRMAEALATHRFTSREAAQLYAAWRDAAPAIRQRILEQPQLFLKAQRQREPDPPADGVAELLRDLEMVAAITRRANRRLAGGATVELDRPQCLAAQSQIDRARQELNCLAAKIPLSPAQEQAHVEPSTTHHDSGTECARREPKRDCPSTERQPADGTQNPTLELDSGAGAVASGESRTAPPADPGVTEYLQGESGACGGGVGGLRSQPVVLDADRLLPPSWDRATAGGGGGPLRVSAGRGVATRHLPARARAGRQAPQSADRLGRAGLLPHVVLPDVSELSAFRLQGLSDRGTALLPRCSTTRHDRQHPCGGAARHRTRDGAGARDGRLCRTFRLPLRGA